MRRSSSVSTKIKFAHIPKDGKTPVWNASAGKWEMHDAPTVQQLEASVNKLKDVSDKAVAADTAAKDAKKIAESKISEAEALDAVRIGVFDVSTIGSRPFFRTVEFSEESSGAFKVWIHFGAKDAPPTSASKGWLAYADLEEFKELCDRVLALEMKLGI